MNTLPDTHARSMKDRSGIDEERRVLGVKKKNKQTNKRRKIKNFFRIQCAKARSGSLGTQMSKVGMTMRKRKELH